MHIVLILALAVFACGFGENFLHQRNLRKLSLRVLVNGTRGKSSVTRLVAGALREAGRTTIAKTTGSAASIILEDGTEMPIERRLGPRITEQKAFTRLAVAREAQAIVVECMAVRPESQEVFSRQLVRPTLCVITNARVDHIEEMGNTEEDTVAALSFSIPSDGVLVATDRRFEGKAGRFVVADASLIGADTLARFSYPVFAENVALALQVSSELGIDRETALRGMAAARPDIGAMGLFRVESSPFSAIVINGFAANDRLSTGLVWEKAVEFLPEDLPLVLLYNNRADREYRISEFLKLPRGLKNLKTVAVAGEHARKVARLFAAHGLDSLAIEEGTDCETLLSSLGRRLGSEYILFGIGNIRGMGRKLMEYCAEHGRQIGWAGEERC
ncbi:MAG: poly-gamma-glutamate synthase PgsB [Rectinemataceae bacterium]